MQLWETILFIVTGLALLIATYTDLKKREVPDWVNYGLIFSGLGLRMMFSFEYGWILLLNGLLGFLFCWLIAYIFYSTNQWGGGDSKLLMGIGAVLGLGLTDFGLKNFDFSLFLFFIGLLVLGAVFGLFWSLFLAVWKRKEFWPDFLGLVNAHKRLHLLVWLFSFAFVFLTLSTHYFWPMIFFPVGVFYLLNFVKGVEQSCFVREIDPEQLVEGDWLAEDLFSGRERLAEKGKALQKEQVWKIRQYYHEGKLRGIMVKEGIPFVPGFLLSYLVLALGLWGAFLTSIF